MKNKEENYMPSFRMKDDEPIANRVEHTLLKPDADAEKIKKLCDEAREHNFGFICVNAFWVKFCAAELEGSNTKVGVTIGFPLGATSTKTKAFETKQAIKDGAREVDMVLNVGALKSGMEKRVKKDVEAVVEVAHAKQVPVKVILENCLLTKEEIVRACLICKDAGADFVKTSTGFNGPGANVDDVKLMRETVGEEMGVKAAGGIRSYEDAVAMIKAGADRLGTSSGVKIMEEYAASTEA